MNVCVIGGGASGLVSAVCAALAGDNVKILEVRDRVGKKILATGNGKCNMTNADMSLSHYHGLKSEEDSRALVSAVFERFPQKETLRFFEELGIVVMYKNGYAYPNSEQASSVLDVLRYKLDAFGVKIICDCNISDIRRDKDGFSIVTNQGKISADKVILSCGSRASLADNIPDGYSLAKKLGHTVVGPLPALVPITSPDPVFKSLSGIRVRGSIAVFDEKNNLIADDKGEIQLANYGISGIPAFMVSYQVAKYIKMGRKLTAVMDFMPECSMDELKDMLKNRAANSYKTAENYLIGFLNKNLALAIIKECGIDLKLGCDKLTDEMIDNIAGHIKSFTAELSGTKALKDAQVSAGGIDVCEVNPNLESKKVKGLYFAGEMLDVHGDCGGYNLQWAFSSGMVCGYDKN